MVGRSVIPANWTPPMPPAPGQNWEVPAGSSVELLYRSLRDNNPDRRIGEPVLQGVPKPKIGDPNPTYPGQTIRSRDNGAADGGDEQVVSPDTFSFTQLVL
jgi:hypothetical protein